MAVVEEHGAFPVALATWKAMTGAPRDARWKAAINIDVQPDLWFPVRASTSGDLALFNDVSWERRCDRLRVHYREPSSAHFAWEGDVHVDHWARRAGDTLTIKTYAHQKFETDGAGPSSLTGVYLPCQ